MKKNLARQFLYSLIGLGIGLAGPAAAAPVDSFGSVSPGWFVGSGQPNGGFNIATNTAAGVQIGLRSQDYTVGVSANNGPAGNDYFVAGGPRSPAQPGLSKWNIDLSINTGTRPIASFFDVFFEVDWDPTAGVDMVVYDIDAALTAGNFTGSLFQSSENLGFAFWGHAFDPEALGTYTFSLTVFEKGTQNLVASRDIAVHVPEPGSLALLLLALAGLTSVMARRPASVGGPVKAASGR